MAFGRLKVDELETSTQTVSVDALVGIAADGDKGDITISGSGTVWSIDDGAVDTAALGGDITAAGKALLDDADAAAQRTTLGAEAAGTAASAISTHEAAADPHPGYALESSLGGAALLDVGTTTGTVAAGDDGRFTTDLSYTASTRVLASSTGADATLPLFTSTDAGLAPLSGGGTTNFLRADGTWATPATGGTPGGTTGQLQWNSSGTFAGVGGSTVGATGDITLSLNGAASTPPVSLTGTWFSGGTSTTTKPQFLIEPTGTTSTAWSTSGTGLGVNAPSGFTGNLLDLQVDGTSQLKVNKGGQISIPFAATRTAQFNGGNFATGFGVKDGDYLYLACGNRDAIKFDVVGHAFGNTYFKSDHVISWSTGNGDANKTAQLSVTCDAAGILAQRNGTNAQTYRLYNTFTDASNYERAYLRWASNVLEIGTEGAGTGSEKPVRITAATLKLPNLPTYADNAAATSGGLVAGDVYKTATGELRITV